MKLKLASIYDKIALSLAVLTTAVLGGMIYQSAGRAGEDFRTSIANSASYGGPNPPIEELEETARRVVDGTTLANSRDVFTGKAWFVTATGRMVDLTDASASPVHLGIPDSWWPKHGIDPGFADSPQRDPDRDGFSNREEFEGETDPVDRSDHPPLIAKLRVADLDSTLLRLTYNTHTCDGAPTASDRFGFRYEDSERRRNSQSGIPAGQGAASVFFADAPGQLRFELKDVRQELIHDPRINIERREYIATIVDRRPNKDGREYEVRKGRSGLLIRDYIATLFVDVPGRATERFAVEENVPFALEGDHGDAAKKYRFTKVREGANGTEVVIEETRDGESLLRHLPVPNP